MGDIRHFKDRATLYNEFHARPFVELRPPEHVSHYAMLHGSADATAQSRAYVNKLCDHYDAPRPADDSNHFMADLGPVRLKWERHTEYDTYLFLRRGNFDDPFRETADSFVDRRLLEEMPGELIVGTHAAVVAGDPDEDAALNLDRYFVMETLCGSTAAGGAANIWTDYQRHADGFGRILIRDFHLGHRQAGRLMQRLVEIDTYRVLAMMALPQARRSDPEITRIERGLAKLTTDFNECSTIEDESRLLRTLTELSGEVEEISAANSYRFGAARAYYELVVERTQRLRETRVAGFQTIAEFMDRRLAPAMRTCQSIAEREEGLANRVERAANLLRTRVDITLEGQNRDLLLSMNRRAKLQLRLQETVEGVSIAAITYYVVSLIGYAVEGMSKAGVELPKSAIMALSIPAVAGLVWWAISRMRRRIMAEGAEREDDEDEERDKTP